VFGFVDNEQHILNSLRVRFSTGHGAVAGKGKAAGLLEGSHSRRRGSRLRAAVGLRWLWLITIVFQR